MLSTPGTWVVQDHHGELTEWSDSEFRKMFEPADNDTSSYLASISKS